jgi:hypothetical protein
VGKLDIQQDNPEHFRRRGPYSSRWQVRWEMKLTRRGPSSGYGNDAVVFDQDGFNRGASSIPDALAPNN